MLLVGLADAVVTIAIYALAWVSIVQIDIGWAMWAGSGTELREVTGVARSSTCCSRGLQLQGESAWNISVAGQGGSVATPNLTVGSAWRAEEAKRTEL